jgi:murein DD-endopeptidase MepM/ murein hydrolase activator NlpD
MKRFFRFRRWIPWTMAALLLTAPILACSRETAGYDPSLAAAETAQSAKASPTSTVTPTASPTDLPTSTATVTATPRPTVTPWPTETFPPTLTRRPQVTPLPKLYITQSGDTLRTIALRFGILSEDIGTIDGSELPAEGLLSPGLNLRISVTLPETTPNTHLFPDSAIVASLSSANFDTIAYIKQQGGYLAAHTGELYGSGGQLLRQIAFNNSFSPKLLLALLEYESGWVTEKNPAHETINYPLGHRDANMPGLANQLIWATNVLSIGYYGWRDASFLRLTYGDGETLPLAPDLNAGTVALMNFFAVSTESRAEAEQALADFTGLYTDMFGDPFDQAIDPLYYPDMPRPQMELPFYPGQKWGFSWGPHGAWEREGARAAVDFAPPDADDCEVAGSWVTASAPGLIVRSFRNVVVIDLDGDGLEETGWNILYLHIADKDRIAEGSKVEIGTRLGHASCEGGISTGTHVHMARKFNGEWMLAGGPVPMVLSGWVVAAGPTSGTGTMTRDGIVAIANPVVTGETFVWR